MEEHDGVFPVVGNDQVENGIAVKIAHHNPAGLVSNHDHPSAFESAIPIAKDNGDVIRLAVGGDSVKIAIQVEITHCDRIGSEPNGDQLYRFQDQSPP